MFCAFDNVHLDDLDDDDDDVVVVVVVCSDQRLIDGFILARYSFVNDVFLAMAVASKLWLDVVWSDDNLSNPPQPPPSRSLRLLLNDFLNPSIIERFFSLNGLGCFCIIDDDEDDDDVGSPFWFIIDLSMLDEPLWWLCIRGSWCFSCLIFVLDVIRTDLDVCVGPSVDDDVFIDFPFVDIVVVVVGVVVDDDDVDDFDFSRLAAIWAGGCDKVFLNEGFHNEHSSGAELIHVKVNNTRSKKKHIYHHQRNEYLHWIENICRYRGGGGGGFFWKKINYYWTHFIRPHTHRHTEFNCEQKKNNGPIY